MEWVGVILAAGRGRRMGPLGEVFPKALLPVGCEPLIGWQLKLLNEAGASHVYIVVGHRSADVVRTVGDGARYGVPITYVEQGLPCGSAAALMAVRSQLTSPFVLLLGDYLATDFGLPAVLRRLEAGESVMLVKREANAHLLRAACSVELAPNARVQRIIEKPFRARGYKGCGLYALQPDFLDVCARTPRTALRDEYEISVALDLYVDAGGPLYAETTADWDVNMTTPGDLLSANAELMRREGRSAIVCDGAVVDMETVLERTVVGAAAHVTGWRRLSDVVVLPGARTEGTGELVSALVTPAGVLPEDVPSSVELGRRAQVIIRPPSGPHRGMWH